MEDIIQIQEDRVRDLFNENISVGRLTTDTYSKSYVFDNQIETAKDIIYNFYTKKNRWCLLFAEMQSGKSGTFFSIPYIISRNNILTKKLAIDMFDKEINVFLLTGMNEKELISQFEKDIDAFTGMDIKKNVLHNSEMRKFLSRNEKEWSKSDKIVIDRMRRNSLILIDESHYGSDKDQILDKFLTKILNINPNGDNTELINNNIYVVSISATPMAEFLNANISEFKKKIIPLKNAEGYWGIVGMFDKNKIYQSHDLKNQNSIDKMLDDILNIKKSGYILVRCTSTQQNKIKNRIEERKIKKLQTINYDQYEKSRILDNSGINDILGQATTSKVIIFLKGLLRAGKRVDTKNIIMVHDTSDSKVDTTVQSLLGRCCGYGKNQEIVIYCDKESAFKYKLWVESGYDLESIPDKSKNILSNKRGKSNIRIETFRSPIEFDVSNNSLVLDKIKIVNGRAINKTRNEKIDILRSLNSKEINSIIDFGILDVNYTIGSIFTTDINKDNTSYKKQYLSVLNSGIFMGDYKPKDGEEGKIVFSAAYDIHNKKILVSFGQVVKPSIIASENSMYHESNIVVNNKFRKCGYRNCVKSIKGPGNRKFCCRSHQSQEAVYNMREKKYQLS